MALQNNCCLFLHYPFFLKCLYESRLIINPVVDSIVPTAKVPMASLSPLNVAFGLVVVVLLINNKPKPFNIVPAINK